MKIPTELREALDRTGLPWELEEGTKHNKVKLVGHLVGIYPKGRKREAHRRALLNTITQVRNAARQIKEIL
jgi:hypothetical protein